MSYKITLIEYDEDIYDGDDLEPQIQFKEIVNSGAGQVAITNSIEADRRSIYIDSQINELYNYVSGVALPLILSGWWEFEANSSGDILFDSQGSNDLLSSSSSYPTENLIDFKQGSSSAEFDGINQFAGIDDANLDASFPLKNGDTTKKIGITFWLKLHTFTPLGNGYERIIFTKGIGAADKSIEISVYQTGGSNYLRVRLSLDGTSYDYSYTHASPMSTNTWYFVGVSYGLPVDADSSSSYELRIRMWDDTAQAILGVDYFTEEAIETFVGAGYLSVGKEDDSDRTIDGLLDDLRVYRDNITLGQIDAIRVEEEEEEA